jgi:hypothetical protein
MYSILPGDRLENNDESRGRNTVARRNRRRPRRPGARVTSTSARSVLISALVVCVLAYVAALIANESHREAKERSKPVYFGELVPSGDKPPELGAPFDAVQLLLGDGLAIIARHSDTAMIAVNGHPLITIGMREGRVRITAKLADQQNRRLFTVIDNEFNVDQQAGFNPRMPDAHTLVVRDIEDTEVLNVKYIAPRVIRIVGRFHLPGMAGPVVIDAKDGIRWPGGGGIGHMSLWMLNSSATFLNITTRGNQ